MFAGSQLLADKAHKLSGEEPTTPSNLWIVGMESAAHATLGLRGTQSPEVCLIRIRAVTLVTITNVTYD